MANQNPTSPLKAAPSATAGNELKMLERDRARAFETLANSKKTRERLAGDKGEAQTEFEQAHRDNMQIHWSGKRDRDARQQTALADKAAAQALLDRADDQLAYALALWENLNTAWETVTHTGAVDDATVRGMRTMAARAAEDVAAGLVQKTWQRNKKAADNLAILRRQAADLGRIDRIRHTLTGELPGGLAAQIETSYEASRMALIRLDVARTLLEKATAKRVGLDPATSQRADERANRSAARKAPAGPAAETGREVAP